MKNLYIFDFDDTIVSTGSLVRVKSPTGKDIRYMTSAEFADPECPKHMSACELSKGYYEDFSDFELYPPDPIIIRPIFDIFKKLVNAKKNVAIITARGNAGPIIQFLFDRGLDSIPIYAVGGSDPTLKCNIVRELLMHHSPQGLILFEDSKKNISAISSMMENFSNINFNIIEVPHVKWLNDKRIRKIV